jgi:hypothetical protein
LGDNRIGMVHWYGDLLVAQGWGNFFDLVDNTPLPEEFVAYQGVLTPDALTPYRRRSNGPRWVRFPMLGPEALVELERWGNPKQTRMMDNARRTWGDRRTGEIPRKHMDDILARVMAQTVLVGMENVQTTHGPLDDTLENRLYLLDAFPDLRELIFEAAQDPDHFASLIPTGPRPQPVRIEPPSARPSSVALARFANLDDDPEED